MGGIKKNIESIQSFINVNHPDSIVLTKTYKNCYTPLNIQCSCGNCFQTTWTRIQQNHWCPECCGKAPITIKKIVDFVGDHHVKATVLSKKYGHSKSKLKIMCEQGHEFCMRWTAIQQGQWCPKCAGLAKKDINFIKKYINDFHTGSKLISKRYVQSRIKLEIICENEHTFFMRWNNIQQGQWCPKCAGGTSKVEKQILEFVKSLGVNPAHRDRTVLDGKEIDIYIPSKKIGIEYHGLYWHCSKNLANFKKAHREKHLLAKEKGVQLIQFFEDEWRDKQDICKSMIRHRLGMSQNKIFARKCEIKAVEPKDRKEFFNNTHIAGDARAKYALGLYFKGELIECISFRLPYTKKQKNNIEIARLASKQDTSVIGGFQKLLKHSLNFLRQECPDKQYLITYGDARFGYGNVYHKTGFEYEGFNSPGYFYTNINQEPHIREFRFKHKKVNDPEYMAKWGKTEKDQNHNQGWFEVFDCGHYSFKMKLFAAS